MVLIRKAGDTALSHVASKSYNVLRRIGFELGAPDHESDTVTARPVDCTSNLGGVVVREPDWWSGDPSSNPKRSRTFEGADET